MRTRWVSALVAAGLVLAGCGSSGSQGGGASTPTPAPSATSAPSTPAPASTASAQLCADAAALQASLTQLGAITVGSGSVTELQNDLKDVPSALTALANSARSEWQDQISALQASLTTLQTAIQQLATNPGTSTVAAARTALQGVGTAGRNLFAAVGASCPSLSPSPTTS